jgi:hypothetical protein
MHKPEMMVRLALVMGLLVAMTFAAVGDAVAEGRFGFFGGLNIANMGGDMEDLGNALAAELEDEIEIDVSVEKTSKTGLGFGAYYFHPLSPTLGFQLEGQYIRRGVKLEFSGTGMEVDSSLKLDYIEFPMLLRLSPGPGNDMRPVFFVGPVIGFNAKAEYEFEGEGMSETEDVKDEFKSTTFGALLGAGLSVTMNEKSTFLLQARYYLGLSNAVDDDEYSSKAGDFGFFVGMEFGM